MATIAGRQPVLEALRSGRPLNRILVAAEIKGSLQEIKQLATARGVPVERVDRARLDRLTQVAHQGVVAVAGVKEYVGVDDMLAAAARRGQPPLMVMLREITDPQNLGAIMRSAEAGGADGIIIPAHRAAGLTDTVAKVSAGAVEYLPVARVHSLRQALERLKGEGLWAVGLEAGAPEVIWQVDLSGPLVLVVGSEAKGVGPVLARTCDTLARLPVYGRVSSLNAATAAAVAIYEVQRQRTSKS